MDREREMRMRDRAMRRRMRRDMRENSIGRYTNQMQNGIYQEDGRNPYGSKGGYVTSRRSDYAMGRDYRGMDYNQYGSTGNDYTYSEQDMARGRRDYESGRQSNMGYGSNMMDGHYPMEVYGSYGNTPFYMKGRQDYARGRDYNYDYGYMPIYDYGRRDYGEEKLSKEELEDWIEDLKEEIDAQYKSLYSKEKIETVAKQMGIEMDKFNLHELMVTTLMMATDYAKSVGQADIQRNVAMAKEWLCDKDSKLKYGEKLSAYYDNIIKGDD